MKKIFLITFLVFSFFIIGCENDNSTPNNESDDPIIDVESKEHYTVTYKDLNGTIVYTETVKHGEKALGYTLPNYPNLIFKGWSQDLDIINKDLEVYPIYDNDKTLYRIEFELENAIITYGNSVQYVEEGQMPVVPLFYKEHYEFVSFDTEVVPAINNTTYKAIYKQLTIKDISPFELIEDIRFGWNYLGGIAEDNDDEKILDLLLEKNINAVELPIEWCDHCNIDYVIDEDYLNQVYEFTKLAISKGMYVLICSYDYYDTQWSSLNYNNYYRLLEVMNIQWQQIGEKFKDFDEHVLFSFLNEPRDYTDNELDSEAFHILNEVNQMFVKKIRNQGGNNKYRHLIINTGWGRIDGDSYNYLEIPDDNHLIIGLHLYTPYTFVDNTSVVSTSFSEKEAEFQIEILSKFQYIYEKYTLRGIPTMITEFGSRDKDNDIERGKWIQYYLSCAKAFNMKCFIWDCKKINKNVPYTFGVIDRDLYQWNYPDYTNVISDIYCDNKYLDFFYEVRNSRISFSEEISILKEVTSTITGDKKSCIFIYDETFFTNNNGKLLAKQMGTTIIELIVDNYKYYYELTFVADFETLESSFALEIKENEKNQTQCYILTIGYSKSRIDYDWFSSDTDILTISMYSTITINKDGVVGIIAKSKTSDDYGVIQLVIKDKKIVSYVSEVTKSN